MEPFLRKCSLGYEREMTRDRGAHEMVINTTKTPDRALEITYQSVEACAEEIGVSPRHLREQIRRNQFPHLRIGHRIILPRHAILEFLNRKALESLQPIGEHRPRPSKEEA
jgi:hypothetical protein